MPDRDSEAVRTLLRRLPFGVSSKWHGSFQKVHPPQLVLLNRDFLIEFRLQKCSGDTVDGRNPAPLGQYKTL